MKSKFSIIITIMLLLVSACTKEDNLPHLQSHDKNKMIILTHQMMSQMDTIKQTMDPEIDFLIMINVLFQGAIEMARLELKEGKDDSLQRTAQKIINNLQPEIAQFQIYLASSWINISIAPIKIEHEESIMKMAMLSDIQFITGDIDNDFATLMILHHQAATENAQSYLKYGNDNQVRIWAQKIIDAQKIEVMELRSWLKIFER